MKPHAPAPPSQGKQAPRTPAGKGRGPGGSHVNATVNVVSRTPLRFQAAATAAAITPPGAVNARPPTLKRKREGREISVNPHFDIYEEIKKFTAACEPLCVMSPL